MRFRWRHLVPGQGSGGKGTSHSLEPRRGEARQGVRGLVESVAHWSGVR
jgi:hypothetical protein